MRVTRRGLTANPRAGSSDVRTFVRGEGTSLQGDRTTLTIESSREYSERAEAEQIVGLLKGIVKAASP